MKLAFSGKGRYTDFSEAYELYKKRNPEKALDEKTYKRVIRKYCGKLAARLKEEGMVDLPKGLGSISTALILRKPQYRGKQFVGYGAMDWKKGHRDGKLKAFGLVFLPRRDKNPNLRCFGFVANRRLFQMLSAKYESGNRNWEPIEFNDEMI